MSKRHADALERRWKDAGYRAKQTAVLLANAANRRGQKRPRPSLRVRPQQTKGKP